MKFSNVHDGASPADGIMTMMVVTHEDGILRAALPVAWCSWIWAKKVVEDCSTDEFFRSIHSPRSGARRSYSSTRYWSH